MQAYRAFVRTTVSIDALLLSRARRVAADTDRTLSDLVEDGLRLLLAEGGRGSVSPVVLPVFGGSGLLSGVDLEDKEGLPSHLG
jgi:hypothetical protein